MQSASTSRIARVCAGVPASRFGVAILCRSELGTDRFRLCESCDAEIERRNAIHDSADTDRDLQARLERAGLPRPFITGSKSLDTFRTLSGEHERARVAVRRWLEWRDDDGCTANLLVRGGPGIGKSHLLLGAVREAVCAGKVARYVNARDLSLRLQASFRDNSPESAHDVLNYYTSPEHALFLAWDDIGATKTTRFVADCAYTLLERRARAELPTIISTNYSTMRELAERLLPVDGDALDAIRPTDRIDELCPNAITLRGDSQRSIVGRSRGDE